MQTTSAKAIVTHPFNVSAEQIFDAWLDPKMIARFMFGPSVRPNESIIHLRNDPRVNGTFSYLVKRGDTEINHIGTYTKIERPGTLAFTWAVAGQGDSSDVIIQVIANPSGCVATLAHEMQPQWAEFVSKIEGSWRSMMEHLDRVFKEQGDML